MKRYLVFDSGCSACTTTAHKVCNEIGGWIHDVLSLQDIRAKDWLRKAGLESLSSPAIVLVEDEQVRVLHGAMFRWRLLQVLGPARAFKLTKVIAGDLAAAKRYATVDDHSETVRSGGAQQFMRPKVSEKIGRRKFLGLATTASAVFMVVTGLGFSKYAKASQRGKVTKSIALNLFAYPWMRQLTFTGAKRTLDGAERNLAWREFVSSPNMARLISSPNFDAWKGAPGVRNVLFSNAVPVPARKGMFMSSTEDENAGYAGWTSTERETDDGQVVTVRSLHIGAVVLVEVELRKEEKRPRRELRMYTIDQGSKSAISLAALRYGSFFYQRPDDFAPPNPPNVATIGGDGLMMESASCEGGACPCCPGYGCVVTSISFFCSVGCAIDCAECADVLEDEGPISYALCIDENCVHNGMGGTYPDCVLTCSGTCHALIASNG